MPDTTEAPDLEIKPLPESVWGQLAAPENGAAWQPDDAEGRTLFDTPHSEDNTVLVVFPQARCEQWRSQALAHVFSEGDTRKYLGQVVKGPYAAPNGLPATSPLLLATQIEGTLFTPPYHGWVQLAILSEVDKDGNVTAPLLRPRPNSKVKLLDLAQTRAALRCDGDLRLGQAVGNPGLPVGLRSDEKHHVPRPVQHGKRRSHAEGPTQTERFVTARFEQWNPLN